MEGVAQHAHEEVNGICQPGCLAASANNFYDEEVGEGGQLEIARLLFDELQSAFLQQGNPRYLAGRADFFLDEQSA